MGALQAAAQGKPIVGENTDFTNSLNNGDRVEWFRDQGFGLFIHWSVDSQLGVTISHSLVGASQDYTERFFNELPKTFDPVRFDPAEWARLALATWPSAKFERELKAHHWLFVNSPEKLDPLY